MRAGAVGRGSEKRGRAGGGDEGAVGGGGVSGVGWGFCWRKGGGVYDRVNGWAAAAGRMVILFSFLFFSFSVLVVLFFIEREVVGGDD